MLDIQNVILSGIIPGPSEPNDDINSFTKPLVDELLEFWNGIPIRMQNGSTETVRAALLCVACDMPAGRKCCGFLAHNATMGCNKCTKRCPGGFGPKDYSGFERSQWIPRNIIV